MTGSCGAAHTAPNYLLPGKTATADSMPNFAAISTVSFITGKKMRLRQSPRHRQVSRVAAAVRGKPLPRCIS